MRFCHIHTQTSYPLLKRHSLPNSSIIVKWYMTGCVEQFGFYGISWAHSINYVPGTRTRQKSQFLFILLDEVYASLDNAAILEIEQAIQELCSLNCCILFVTHRREWIPKDSRIYCLDACK